MILGKSYTRDEYLRALTDTAATAALTTVGATGVTHPFVVGTRSPVSSKEQTRQAPESQPATPQTQQMPEIKQSNKEEVPGVKPGEYAATQQAQAGKYEAIKKKIGELYDYAAGKLSNKKQVVNYGVVDHVEAERLKKATGLDVDGYTRVIDNYSIRHILKGHTSQETEEARGNIAITKDDTVLIPEIIETADRVTLSPKKTKTGQEAIRYEKRISGSIYVYEEVRTGKKELMPVTMYKKRVATNDMSPSGPLVETSSNTSETLRNPSKSIIQSSAESVKPAPATLTPEQLTSY